MYEYTIRRAKEEDEMVVGLVLVKERGRAGKERRDETRGQTDRQTDKITT